MKLKLKSKKERKLQKGITLIALVITIIVLLILAGVSIATLTGDNGIIGKAQTAKEETIVAQEKEILQMAYTTALAKQKTSTESAAIDGFVVDFNKELENLEAEATATKLGTRGKIQVIFSKTQNRYILNYQDGNINLEGQGEEEKIKTVEEAKTKQKEFDENTPLNDKTITIPEGFKVSQSSPTNIDEGIIIEDENGNEFVWIPCDVKDDTASEETADGKVNYNAKRDEDWKAKQYYYNGGTWGDSQPATIGKTSVETYKGFYVARYEAGIPKNAPFYPNESNENKYYKNESGEPTKDTDQYTPVSKKGEPVWNYISQTKAKEAAKKMVSNGNVQSYLMDSYAWDTICRVIAKNDENKSKSSLTDSTIWGNYYNNNSTNYGSLNTLYALHSWNISKGWTVAGTYTRGKVEGAPKNAGENRLELSTGASEDFKAYNIYDLAGNVYEWTTENGNRPATDSGTAEIPTVSSTDVSGATHAVFCGGGFAFSGSDNPVVYVYGFFGPSYCKTDLGFRAVLYLK